MNFVCVGVGVMGRGGRARSSGLLAGRINCVKLYVYSKLENKYE